MGLDSGMKKKTPNEKNNEADDKDAYIKGLEQHVKSLQEYVALLEEDIRSERRQRQIIDELDKVMEELKETIENWQPEENDCSRKQKNSQNDSDFPPHEER